jgi:hypothetical protein
MGLRKKSIWGSGVEEIKSILLLLLPSSQKNIIIA